MIVVNFSTKEYRRGQKRLEESLNGYKKLMLSDYVSIGSPTHAESPYEFKCHAIEKASKLDPVVLWMDSSMYVKGDLSKIEKIILEDGYFMEEAGHYVGRWTNDFTKKYFNLSEEEIKQDTGGMIMFSAGLLGLNFNFTQSRIFFSSWLQAAKDGCFRGDWSDHRHDMSVASIIAEKIGMKYQRGGSHLSYVGPGYSKPEVGSVVYCQGIN
jgi:hypothetical protein